MKKIAIIGASYLQAPLISKAKDMGFETHVFAWKCNDIGEKLADYYYPISIIEKETILKKCRDIGVSGICSIASDLATITVNYIAQNLKLVGNSDKCTFISTNKHEMRKTFEYFKLPSPKSILVSNEKELDNVTIDYPVIVKPTDRSGSRGITKVDNYFDLIDAFHYAREVSFEKKVLVEEYALGQEYSVECISQNGQHHLLTITKKYTTGSPHFIETGHIEPGIIDIALQNRIKEIVFKALEVLDFKNGASHSEIKIDEDENIKIIEIGCRMGGDLIGSHLVYLSTGVDYVKQVINVSIGKKIDKIVPTSNCYAAVKYLVDKNDFDRYNSFTKNHGDLVIEANVNGYNQRVITDSSSRLGYFVVKTDNYEDIKELFEGQSL